MFPWQCAVGQQLGCTKRTFNRLGWATLPALDSNMLGQWNEPIQSKMSVGYPFSCFIVPLPWVVLCHVCARQSVLATLPMVTHVWVVVHHQQVLGAPLWARPLVSSNKAGDVVVLKQRQPVDGTLVEEILPVGCSEHFNGYWPLIQRATVDGAVSPTANELKSGMVGSQENTIYRF